MAQPMAPTRSTIRAPSPSRRRERSTPRSGTHEISVVETRPSNTAPTPISSHTRDASGARAPTNITRRPRRCPRMAAAAATNTWTVRTPITGGGSVDRVLSLRCSSVCAHHLFWCALTDYGDVVGVPQVDLQPCQCVVDQQVDDSLEGLSLGCTCVQRLPIGVQLTLGGGALLGDGPYVVELFGDPESAGVHLRQREQFLHQVTELDQLPAPVVHQGSLHPVALRSPHVLGDE